MRRLSRLTLTGLSALLLTWAAPTAQASWTATVADVMNLVYCVVGLAPCEGLEPAGSAGVPTCDWLTDTWDGSACVPIVECPETETAAAPFYITTMTHLEGAWNYDDMPGMPVGSGDTKFNNDLGKIEAAMDLFDAYGAKLTIESEIPFAEKALAVGSTIFDELMTRGHGVGSHCDITPTLDLPPALIGAEFTARKAPMDLLIGPENNLGCSGGQGYSDWILGAHLAGFEYIDGVVGFAYLSMPPGNRPDGWDDDYILDEGHFHDNAPIDLAQRIHPFMMADALDFVPDEDGVVFCATGGIGKLSYFAETAAGINCYVEDCDAFTSSDNMAAFAAIDEALALHDPTRVGHVDLYFPLSHFVSENEVLTAQFLSQLKTDYIDTGKLQWATQTELYQAYKAWNGLE